MSSAVVFLLCSFLIALAWAGPTGRIVGGETAVEGQFGHQVSLRVNKNHNCGGSIISKRDVVTAAHCVVTGIANGTFQTYDPNSLTIRAGSKNRFSGGVLIGVKSIQVHADYGDFLNDVALLKLSTDLIFSEFIQPIALASSETPAGEDVVISGWGRIKTGGEIPTELKFNTLKAISKLMCALKIQSYEDSLLCLDHNAGDGACNGDSGGPAVWKKELVGVAGFVVGGCGSNNPDGYAKIFYHKEWIEERSEVKSTGKIALDASKA